MRYKKFPPSKSLKPYIENYYIWQDDSYRKHPFQITRPASPSFAMVFNLGDPYFLFNHKFNGKQLPQCLFSGQSTGQFTLVLPGRIDMVGIIFRGCAFRNIFSFPNLEEFLDDRVDLSNLFGYEIQMLLEKLASAPTDLYRNKFTTSFCDG